MAVLTNGPAPRDVKMVAIAFGTTCGATGDILHVNPDGSDKQAREPMVTAADAVILERAGLAKRADDDRSLEEIRRDNLENESGIRTNVEFTGVVGAGGSGEIVTGGAPSAGPVAGVEGTGLSPDDPDAPPAPSAASAPAPAPTTPPRGKPGPKPKASSGG